MSFGQILVKLSKELADGTDGLVPGCWSSMAVAALKAYFHLSWVDSGKHGAAIRVNVWSFATLIT